MAGTAREDELLVDEQQAQPLEPFKSSWVPAVSRSKPGDARTAAEAVGWWTHAR
jgi:hypothetical protein